MSTLNISIIGSNRIETWEPLQRKILEREVHNLTLMERQYVFGENVELCEDTLGNWNIALKNQRELVDRLKKNTSS